jgi:putative hsdS
MSECDVKEFKLRELLKIYNGTKYDHLNKGDIPLYGSGGLMSHVDEALYSGEAILLPRKGTLSNIMYVNESFWTVDTMYYAVVNDKLADAFYLYSYLSQLDLSNLDSGSTLPSMTKSAYESIVVKLPDLNIQKAVANILFNLRKKLEINNQINQELEAMAKTLYDYWFVQFDFPDQNGKPYKSSGGKMVYNQELKREIPEGWGVEKLDSLLKIGKETTNPKKFPNEEFKYYSIPEFDTTGTYSLERGESIKSNKFKVEKNDLLVSKLNPWFNRVIYNLEENAISSTEFIVWKTFNRFEKNFLYQVATGKEFIEYCTRFATGTSNSHKRVSPDTMIGFQIPFEKTYIQKFGEIIDSIRTQVLQNNEQNRELTRLRDWLLPMLMNGQVKVEKRE